MGTPITATKKKGRAMTGSSSRNSIERMRIESKLGELTASTNSTTTKGPLQMRASSAKKYSTT